MTLPSLLSHPSGVWHVPSDVCMRNPMGEPQAVKTIHVGPMKTGEGPWTRTWSAGKGGMALN